MVNDAETFGIDPTMGHPERALALSYAPVVARAGVAALFALDATLARLTLGTRDAMVAQLRLTWWYEALAALSTDVPPQPILRVLAAAGADGKRLAAMVDGWEALLGAPVDLAAFAGGRALLFPEAALVAGACDDVRAAGEGWALADLARTSGDAVLAVRAGEAAAAPLRTAAAQRWSPAGRFLGALVHVARADLAGTPAAGSPRRVGRLMWHRLSGR